MRRVRTTLGMHRADPARELLDGPAPTDPPQRLSFRGGAVDR